MTDPKDYNLNPSDNESSLLDRLPAWLFDEYAGDFIREGQDYGSKVWFEFEKYVEERYAVTEEPSDEGGDND